MPPADRSGEQHAHPPSAAPTTASAASQQRAIQDVERSAWALEVPEQAGESGVQRLKPGDPVGDLGSSSRDHAGQLGSGVAAVPGVAPAGDPRRFVEREIEAAKVDDQAQVLDIGRPVVAVRVVSPTGSR